MEWYGPRSKKQRQTADSINAIGHPIVVELDSLRWKKPARDGVVEKKWWIPKWQAYGRCFFSKTNGFWAFPIDARAICRAMFKTSGSGGTQLPQSLELGQPQVQRPQLHRKRARVGRVVRGCHRPGVERTLARTWCCGTQQISISLEIR